MPTRTSSLKRPIGTDDVARPDPKRQLPDNLKKAEPEDDKAPQGPLRKHQGNESSDSYSSTSSDSPSPAKPDPTNDILLAGVRILQNGLKPSPAEDLQVNTPTEPVREDMALAEGGHSTEEVDYTVDFSPSDDEICPLDLDYETNKE
jgi:hypothetical protein